jgi:hypothetical protein
MTHHMRSHFPPHSGRNCDTTPTCGPNPHLRSHFSPHRGNNYDIRGWA